MKFLNFTPYLLLFSFISFYSCTKDLENENDDQIITNINDLKPSNSFDWSTTKNVEVKITTLTNDNKPLSKIKVRIYELDIENSIDKTGRLFYTGFTNNSGILDISINIPKYIGKLIVKPDFVGLQSEMEVSINGSHANCTFGGIMSNNKSKEGVVSKLKTASIYSTLGSWNLMGKPNYLTTSDIIDAELLADINASLPEGKKLPESHPQYISNSIESNLVLKDSAEVWVTFVHEGAGYKNVLGYYTYQKNNTPADASGITNLTIIYPNTSFYGSGGALFSGDKVSIGKFPANTVIGWFIVQDGYSTTTGIVSENALRFYSDEQFNPESNSAIRQHNILLKDEQRKLLILGFEDIKRDITGCDQDFNDCVFYATVNPFTAVETSFLPTIDTPKDTDGDGVTDNFDDYPTDPERATNNYYPSKTTFGSLAFEDLWPAKGDYDFNDLVMDYQINQVTNSANQIVDIKQKLVVKAIGAGYHNGFGFMTNLTPADVKSVSGQLFTENYITNNSNGTESGQTKAVIIAFDNAFSVLKPLGSYVNTVVGNTYVQPDTMDIVINLTAPKTQAQIGTLPYNPFLIANKVRGTEIHLPGQIPTDLVNTSLFGTDDDNTNISLSNYYKSKNNLPWGMNLPSSFDYPIEKSSIINGHLKFAPWVQSSGGTYNDWYRNNVGYRNTDFIFHK